MSKIDEDVERQAQAFAKVTTNFFLHDGSPKRKDEPPKPEFLHHAYFFIWSLREIIGADQHWHARRVERDLRDIRMNIRAAEEAVKSLPAPVVSLLDSLVKVHGGMILPAASEAALGARGITLRHAEKVPLSWEAVSGDAHTTDGNIIVTVCTRSFGILAALAHLKRAVEDARPSAENLAAQGEAPGRTNWPAIHAYRQLRSLWEERTGTRPAIRPKDGDKFLRFAERSFEALEVRSTSGEGIASIRSAYEAVHEIETARSKTGAAAD